MPLTSKQIRKRNSYKEFKEFYEEVFDKYIDSRKEAERVMFAVWKLMDSKGRFKYARISYYAKQSIMQLIEDLKFPRKGVIN